MAHQAESQRPTSSWIRVSIPLTLAHWQLRQTWRLLLIVGLGMVVAVILVCAVPLYTQIATTAGLRDTLDSTSGYGDITISATSEQILPDAIQYNTQHMNRALHNSLGPYLSPGPAFSIDVQGPAFHTLDPHKQGNQLELIGASMQEAVSHLKLLQGQLPQPSSNRIEIALPAQAARDLHVKIGDVLTMSVFYDNTAEGMIERDLSLPIVGIFALNANDPFWHQQDFQRTESLYITRIHVFYSPLYRALMSNDAYLAVLARIAADPAFPGPGDAANPGPVLVNAAHLYWYYHLDPARITIDHLNDVRNGLATVLATIAGSLPGQPVPDSYVEKPTSFSNAPNVLADFSRRLAVVNIPVLSLTLLAIGLILFFVSFMTDVLVEYHANELAVLRSRGASPRQLFGSLMVQGVGLGLMALLLGLPLALVAVSLLVQKTLPATDQQALNSITHSPWQAIWGESPWALLAVGAAILAMLLSIARLAHMDVLSLRRETARPTHQAWWMRLRLDMGAAVVALLGFIFSLYVTSPNVLDARTRVLIVTPLTLGGSLFLLLGCTLLILRYFPLLLKLVARLAERRRSAPFILALAQLARTPRQALRTILLLALAIAFAIFTLVFSASQAQRIADVAAYQVGTDFSGQISPYAPAFTSTQNLSKAYRHIKGVTSVSIGYTTSMTAQVNGSPIQVALRAFDADAYAQTATPWTLQDAGQPLSTLMTQLARQRAAAAANSVPAIIDTKTWEMLHLQLGTPFILNDQSTAIHFVPIAEVQHIPPVNDGQEVTDNSTVIAGGILVDYSTYFATFMHIAMSNPGSFILDISTGKHVYHGPTIRPTEVWLRTYDDANSLASVRHTLSQGTLQLEYVQDRRALSEVLRNDPLYRDLVGVLLLGTLAAGLLALVGDLTASWLTAQGRLTSFVVLRALGSTSGQTASVLLWERGVTYSIAIVLGIGFGVLLSLFALPSLVLTSVNAPAIAGATSGDNVYTLQSVPPVQIIVPGTLLLALCAAVVIYIAVSGLMVSVVAKPSMSQTLRLNED